MRASLLVLLLAASPSALAGDAPAPPTRAWKTATDTSRKWTPRDATTARDTLLQQDITQNACNWIRVVEVGRGEPVRPWDAVVLRLSGHTTRAGFAFWNQHQDARPAWEEAIELRLAGAGLQTALTGVPVGSRVQVVAQPALVAPLDRRFHLGGGPRQLHLFIDVVSSKARAAPVRNPRAVDRPPRLRLPAPDPVPRDTTREDNQKPTTPAPGR